MFSNDYSNINAFSQVDEYETPKFDYNSLYRAFVISNEDPKGLGRVQIRIPSLHGINNMSGKDYIQDRYLPFAWPGVFSGAGNQMGSIIIPEVGSIVWVMFEYGDNHEPVYFGGLLTNKAEIEKNIIPNRNVNMGEKYIVENNDIPVELKDNSKKIVYKSIKGATIYIDDTDAKEKIELWDAAGQKIIMMNDADIRNKLDRRTGEREVPDTAYINIVHSEKDYIKVGSDFIDLVSKRVLVNGKPIGTGGSSVSDYNYLDNRPVINDSILEGVREFAEHPLSNSELEKMLK